MLYRMVYCSVATEPVTQGAVHQLLMDSRFNNRHQDINGMLLADQQRYLQILEGPKEAVRALYQRIEADPRHRCIVELLRDEDVQERWYPSWSMGYMALSNAELSTIIDSAIAQLGAQPDADWARSAALLPRVWGLGGPAAQAMGLSTCLKAQA